MARRKRPASPPGTTPQPPATRWRWLRQPWLVASAVVAVLLGLLAWQRPAAEAPIQRPAAAPVSSAFASYGKAYTASAAAAPPREQRVRELVAQVQLTDHTYCSYRDGTRYPSSSRPIAEHPDQVYPNAPVMETRPMRVDGGGSERSIQIHTAQSRVFMAAGEAVVFSLQAVDADGKALPLVVNRALATGITYKDKRPFAPVAVAFADDGANGDAAAGDQAYSGMLAPAKTGLASFNGTIRTEVKYSVSGRAGVAQFDVIYTPELPAVWAGPIRDVVEGGSLQFVLKAEMRQAGRYIVNGRVDDAKGKPFALVSFNDLLPQGSNEIRLTVFGKLLRDAAPAMPLTLRDVDAYLLKENTDPDRALMARIEGPAHVSKSYGIKGFADVEWHSEERTRYLTELGKDAQQARAALQQFSPEAPLPPSECK